MRTARASQIQSTSGICEQDNARGAAAPPASEAFKWILRWRGQNQRLTLSKLRKMKPLLSAPIAAEADAQAHRASAGLCLAACCLWHTDEAAKLAPAQVSALCRQIEAHVAKLFASKQRIPTCAPSRTTFFVWPHFGTQCLMRRYVNMA